MILRQISQGRESNIYIGHQYSFISRERNPEEFMKFANIIDPGNDDPECYGFVVRPDEIIPLYKKQQAYIMTESGKTFDNISYR